MLYNSAMDPERYGPRDHDRSWRLIGIAFAAVSGALVGVAATLFFCWAVGR